MSNTIKQTPQEGTGIYGWDITNPYLQDLYKKKKEDADKNLLETPPVSSTPLVSPLAFLEKNDLFKKRAPQSQQEEINIPYKSQRPVNPIPQDNKPQDPRTLHSFTEGMGLTGKRLWNDLKYSRGYIQDKFSKDHSAASKEALKHLPEYQQKSDEELNQLKDSLQNEVKKNPEHPPINELKGLEKYQDLREDNLSHPEIEQKLSNLSKWGNEGRRLMDEALETNNAFPQTEGLAMTGDVIASIGRIGIPTLAGIASWPVGVALGAGNLLTTIAESHAQAQMELDNYERKTGKPISKLKRAGFTATCLATDFIFDSVLQSRYLKNVKSAAKRKASKFFKDNVLKNRVAQDEINHLMRRIDATDKLALFKGIQDDATLGAISEGISSLGHDVAKTIYANPQDYPTLNEMMEHATFPLIVGGLVGGATGGIGRWSNYRTRQARRHRQNETFAWDNALEGTYEIIDFDPENQIAETINADGQGTTRWKPVNPDQIKVIPFREYREDQRNLKKMKEPDPLRRITIDAAQEEVWQKASPLLKKRMVMDLAERIGYGQAIVYHTASDMPHHVRDFNKDYFMPKGIYIHLNGRRGIVLDEIESYNDLHRKLLFNAIGEEGMKSFFGGNQVMYEAFLQQVYDSMPMLYKVSGDSHLGKLTDAGNYLVHLATSEKKVTPSLKRIINGIRGPLRIFLPGVKLSDEEIKYMITNAQLEVRDDTSWGSRFHKFTQPLETHAYDHNDFPISEINESTYQFLRDYNPEWKGYKRFYDEVYGKEDIPDDLDLPEQE